MTADTPDATAQDIAGQPSKLCTKCNRSFPLTAEFFLARSDRPCGFKSRCRTCVQARDTARRIARTGKSSCPAYLREWRRQHSEQSKQHQKRANEKDRAQGGKYALSRRISGLVRSYLRARKQDNSAAKNWRAIMGYDTNDLRRHLERQFLRGMSWDNMDKWHIDHIVPIRDFKFTSAEDDGFRAAWSLHNLRPLWAKDNLAKGGKRLFLL